MFDSFVFLPLSTRAYFKGRAYIKIILKNHARSYFAGRSYYRGNTVVMACSEVAFLQTAGHEYFLANVILRIFFSQCHNSLVYVAQQIANNLSPIAKKF